MVKILAFAGSNKEQSWNRKLLNIAVAGAKQSAEVTVVDLRDYPMPLFCETLEAAEGMPASARQFKKMMLEHDALMIASPEYNSAFSPLLKNTIDWVSRSEEKDEPGLAAYRGKVAVLMSTSPGGLGGSRGLVFLRMLLANMGVIVLPEQQCIPQAFNAFTAEGALQDESKQTAVLQLGVRLAEVTAQLNSKH